MLLEAVDVHVPIWLSLLVIIGVLGATVVLSLMLPQQHTDEELPKDADDSIFADDDPTP